MWNPPIVIPTIHYPSHFMIPHLLQREVPQHLPHCHLSVVLDVTHVGLSMGSVGKASYRLSSTKFTLVSFFALHVDSHLYNRKAVLGDELPHQLYSPRVGSDLRGEEVESVQVMEVLAVQRGDIKAEEDKEGIERQ